MRAAQSRAATNLRAGQDSPFPSTERYLLRALAALHVLSTLSLSGGSSLNFGFRMFYSTNMNTVSPRVTRVSEN